MSEKQKEIKEVKFVGGNITEVKQEDRNGVKIGIIEGYIATWDIDEGDFFGIKDQFKRGAFVESILEHIQRKRQVRLKDNHGRTVGGFPIEFVREDERGLFGVGEVNLEVQQGRELYSLAKQQVLTDFSIGFSVKEFEMDGNLRTITKAIIWEGSVTDEPMNRAANITQVKNDEGNEMNFYKTHDIKNWNKKDFQKALLEGAQFSEGATKAIISLNIWTGKDQDEDEIEEGEKTYYGIDEIKDWTERDIEKALRAGAKFSKSATKKVMSVIGKIEISGDTMPSDEKMDELLVQLKSFQTAISTR